ncbi:MAG: invasion associated locus B family protein [Xanthobacteraceae bacterium]
MQQSKKEAIRWAIACGLIAALSVPVAAQITPAPPQRPPVAAVPPRTAPAPASKPATETAIDNVPSMTTASYGDWVVRCSQQAEHRMCEAAQTLYVQGQPNPVALVAVGREKPTEPTRLVVQLPVNVTIAGRLKITLKEGAPTIDLNIERCVPAGCFAVMQPADEALRQLRAQTDPGRISYKDAAQHDVAWPFSLRGLSQALEALPKG